MIQKGHEELTEQVVRMLGEYDKYRGREFASLLDRSVEERHIPTKEEQEALSDTCKEEYANKLIPIIEERWLERLEKQAYHKNVAVGLGKFAHITHCLVFPDTEWQALKQSKEIPCPDCDGGKKSYWNIDGKHKYDCPTCKGIGNISVPSKEEGG